MAKKCARSRQRRRIDAGQAQVHLVDERRRLQRMALALAAHVVVGQAAQLLVHDRHQPVSRGGIAVGPIGEDLVDAFPPGGVTIVGHRFGPSGVILPHR